MRAGSAAVVSAQNIAVAEYDEDNNQEKQNFASASVSAAASVSGISKHKNSPPLKINTDFCNVADIAFSLS